jgi:hypothetical protein
VPGNPFVMLLDLRQRGVGMVAGAGRHHQIGDEREGRQELGGLLLDPYVKDQVWEDSPIQLRWVPTPPLLMKACPSS